MLTHIAKRTAHEFPDRAVYSTEAGWSITYAELDTAADEVAAGLTARGVNSGSVVALVMPSTIDYIVCYLALARIGAVTAGINPGLRPREIEACLATLCPRLTLVSDDLADSVGEAHATEQVNPATSPHEVAESLRVRGAGSPPALPDDEDRPVCICFTSGSTGLPKGAWFTNRQLSAISELDTAGAWGGGGHAISPTQFAHVGFMTKLPWLLASGRTTHLLDRWSAGPVLKLISEHQMSAVAGVAPQIALMLRHHLMAELNFDHVKAIVVGGAASSPALVREARQKFGAGYSIRYSSTESGGVGLATALDADDDEAVHTIGRPRSGVEAEIRSADGDQLSDGEIGEMWIRSAAVMSGYWNDPDETQHALVDGWLRTGDLASVDKRGLFRLAGRLKEMFIRGGYNVYPMEVESVLNEHPGVAELVVVPQPDDVMGETGVAVMIVAEGHEAPSLEQLREFGSRDLARYKLPERLVLVDSLPLNSSDKIDRRAVARSAALPTT